MDSKQFCLEQNYNRLTISNGYQMFQGPSRIEYVLPLSFEFIYSLTSAYIKHTLKCIHHKAILKD